MNKQKRDNSTLQFAMLVEMLTVMVCKPPYGAEVFPISQIKEEGFKQAVIALSQGCEIYYHAVRHNDTHNVTESEIDQIQESSALKMDLLTQVAIASLELSNEDLELLMTMFADSIEKLSKQRKLELAKSKLPTKQTTKPKYKK